MISYVQGAMSVRTRGADRLKESFTVNIKERERERGSTLCCRSVVER